LSSSSSLDYNVSTDRGDDYDWKPKGNKNFDVGGRKSGLDLCPVTKPPQCDPGTYYPQPIVRGQKDTAPGEKQ